MKKYLFLLTFLIGGSLYAKDLEIDAAYNLTPGYKTATSVSPSSSTISSPGALLSNCLTDVSLMSTTISNMTILEGELHGGTTLWGLVSVPASTPINKEWTRETALCVGTNSKLVIAVSSGTVSINYNGYVRRKP